MNFVSVEKEQLSDKRPPFKSLERDLSHAVFKEEDVFESGKIFLLDNPFRFRKLNATAKVQLQLGDIGKLRSSKHLCQHIPRKFLKVVDEIAVTIMVNCKG